MPAAAGWRTRRTPGRRCPAGWRPAAGFPWCSFRLDPGLLDDAAPFVDLGLDHLGEFAGRAALDLDAGAAEPGAHVVLLEHRIHRAVQLRHHFLRPPPAPPHPPPAPAIAPPPAPPPTP